MTQTRKDFIAALLLLAAALFLEYGREANPGWLNLLGCFGIGVLQVDIIARAWERRSC